jgi:hypothetical protein
VCPLIGQTRGIGVHFIGPEVLTKCRAIAASLARVVDGASELRIAVPLVARPQIIRLPGAVAQELAQLAAPGHRAVVEQRAGNAVQKVEQVVVPPCPRGVPRCLLHGILLQTTSIVYVVRTGGARSLSVPVPGYNMSAHTKKKQEKEGNKN